VTPPPVEKIQVWRKNPGWDSAFVTAHRINYAGKVSSSAFPVEEFAFDNASSSRSYHWEGAPVSLLMFLHGRRWLVLLGNIIDRVSSNFPLEEFAQRNVANFEDQSRYRLWPVR
jgi:hypothetical protein